MQTAAVLYFTVWKNNSSAESTMANQSKQFQPMTLWPYPFNFGLLFLFFKKKPDTKSQRSSDPAASPLHPAPSAAAPPNYPVPCILTLLPSQGQIWIHDY